MSKNFSSFDPLSWSVASSDWEISVLNFLGEQTNIFMTGLAVFWLEERE
jgi:hypothetical protein